MTDRKLVYSTSMKLSEQDRGLNCQRGRHTERGESQ
jgi:hypothetical protein